MVLELRNNFFLHKRQLYRETDNTYSITGCYKKSRRMFDSTPNTLARLHPQPVNTTETVRLVVCVHNSGALFSAKYCRANKITHLSEVMKYKDEWPMPRCAVIIYSSSECTH